MGKISAAVFSLVGLYTFHILQAGQRLIPESAVGIMGYALYTYHWRANSIRKGGRGPYDDRLGPVSTLRFPVVCHDNSDIGYSRHYSALHF